MPLFVSFLQRGPISYKIITVRKPIGIIAISLIALWFGSAVFASDSVVIRENFANLNDWKPLSFDKAKKDTVYTAAQENGISCLKAESGGSSSAILCNKEFDVYRYPMVRWKWKISNVYAKGDIRKKQDNDSPARLYVMFKYDPEKASFFTKLKYSLAKKIYGRYPPRYALCYTWANRPHKERIIASPGFGEIRYVVLEAGSEQTGKWRQEEVNVLEDFKKAFGIMPPSTAAISFMDDSDNTGEHSTAWLSSLEVMNKQVPSAETGIAARFKDQPVGP
jgi:hypothetical protein